MKNTKPAKPNLSAQEIYQIAKKNEILNQFRKEQSEAAAQEIFNHLADAIHQWTGNRPLALDNAEPLTETITLPEALREPVPKNAFGMPLQQIKH